MLKHKDPVDQLVQFSYRLIIVPAVIFVIGAIIYKEELIQLLYHGSKLSYSAQIFSVIIPGLIAMSTTYIYGTLLTANGSFRQLNIMAATAMVLNIILNIILIPKFHAFGSAIASLTTQSLTALVQILIANKVFGFKTNYNFLLFLLIFIVGISGIGILFKNTFENWFLGFVLIGITGIIAAFALKLIDLKGMFQIIKNRSED